MLPLGILLDLFKTASRLRSISNSSCCSSIVSTKALALARDSELILRALFPPPLKKPPKDALLSKEEPKGAGSLLSLGVNSSTIFD